MPPRKSGTPASEEVEELRRRLSEAEQTLEAIRSGGVDGIVTDTEEGERVFTLQGADTAYRIMVETMSEGALTVDSAGVVLYTNARFSELIGSSHIVGSPLLKFIKDRDHPKLERLLGSSIIGRQLHDEIALVGADGKEVSAWISSTPLEVSGRRDTCVVITDLTYLKQVEKELRDLNDQLEEKVTQRTTELERRTEELLGKNKELESFSYTISHDLRAPLRAINGFSQILEEEHSGQLDEEGGKILQRIRRNTAQMGTLIDDLLSLSRIGNRDLSFDLIDMEALAREAWNETAATHDTAQFTLDIGSLPPARGDGAMIRQVLVNLLSNAVKYGKPGEPNTIRVWGEERDHESAYHVSDTGIGLDMKYGEKLFGVFQRLHASSTVEGTGIGLAIVKRVCERHGGRAWADSKPGRGSIFSFSLPHRAA